MMVWRSLSAKTIVAAAEAVARRKSGGRESGAAPGPTPSGGPGENRSAVIGHPVNDARPAPRTRLAD